MYRFSHSVRTQLLCKWFKVPHVNSFWWTYFFSVMHHHSGEISPQSVFSPNLKCTRKVVNLKKKPYNYELYIKRKKTWHDHAAIVPASNIFCVLSEWLALKLILTSLNFGELKLFFRHWSLGEKNWKHSYSSKEHVSYICTCI